MLRELGVEPGGPAVLYVDNKAAVELAKHRKSCNRSRHVLSCNRSRHVLRRYFKVRELVALGEVEVRWVDTHGNISDALSKGTIAPDQYAALRAALLNGGEPLPALKTSRCVSFADA